MKGYDFKSVSEHLTKLSFTDVTVSLILPSSELSVLNSYSKVPIILSGSEAMKPSVCGSCSSFTLSKSSILSVSNRIDEFRFYFFLTFKS